MHVKVVETPAVAVKNYEVRWEEHALFPPFLYAR